MKNFKRLFKQDRRTILIDKSSTIKINSDEKVDIILSPSFYWMRIEELKIDSLSQVLKIAPSIFENSIPQGNYSYFAIKENGKYTIFAYDEAKIIDFLNRNGVNLSQINNFYFAQTELKDYSKPIKINNATSLVVQNGQLFSIATSYINDYIDFNSLNIKLSKYKIPIKRYNNSLLNEKTIFHMEILLIVLIVLYGIDYKIKKSVLKDESIKLNEIYQKYNLPQTSFEIESIKGKLEKYKKEEEKLRESFKNILSIPFQKGEYIKSLQKDKNIISIEILVNSVKRATIIKKYLENHFKTLSANLKDSKKLYLKLKYE